MYITSEQEQVKVSVKHLNCFIAFCPEVSSPCVYDKNIMIIAQLKI